MTRLKSLVRRTNIALLAAAVATSASLSALAGPVGSPSALSETAKREIARQTARMEEAQQAIEKGDKLFSDGDAESALVLYKAAQELIPNTPATADWRLLATAKHADTCVTLAQARDKTGRCKEARELLDEALAACPSHRGAARLKKRLDDPDHHTNASKEFQEELRNSPYNTKVR